MTGEHGSHEFSGECRQQQFSTVNFRVKRPTHGAPRMARDGHALGAKGIFYRYTLIRRATFSISLGSAQNVHRPISINSTDPHERDYS